MHLTPSREAGEPLQEGGSHVSHGGLGRMPGGVRGVGRTGGSMRKLALKMAGGGGRD